MTTDPVILYVDDERGNRVVFEQSFNRRFKIHVASSGAEALELMKTVPVAVLVTDQRMPGMNGNELLMRAKELYPDAVRVVITAYSELDPILRAVNEGLVARYIVKPWDREELGKILGWAMEAHLLGRQNSALQLRLLETERLVTLGSIGAAIFHDVNQPLSYLMSNSERLSQLAPAMRHLQDMLEHHGGELDAATRSHLTDLATELPDIVADMLEGCRHMQGITSGIRRLLKPTSDRANQLTDPLPVVRYAISVCRDIAVRARGNIGYDGPTTLKRVRMGSTELTQVLINVIANAAQALGRKREPGGRVLVSASDGGEALKIVVVDDGPGMSAEVLQQVGTPFFSTRNEGTGLGVAQCRRLVEQSGGELHLASIEGIGTTVTLRLPFAG